MSGQEGGEIPLGAVALSVPGEPGKTRILLRLRLDGPALLEKQSGGTLRTEISLYALDAGQGVQASLMETIEIDLAALRESVERAGVDHLSSIELRPGPYSLRMLARNLETGRLAVRTLPLTVADPASLDASPPLSPPPAEGDPRVTARSSSLGPLDPPLFPEEAAKQSQFESRAPVAPPSIPDTEEGRRLRSAIRSAYRDALARLAAGETRESVATVAALEDSLLRRAPTPVLVEELVEVEARAARELAEANPESLAPLLRFHQRLHEDATAKRRLQGSTIARDVFLHVAEACRDADRPELARRFETALGMELLRVGSRSRAGQLLLRVLAEDPGNEPILLELAADAERRGARAEAIGRLDALLAAQPSHREARLRRSLDLARLGRTAEAIEGLRGLIRDETDGWRLRIAYQELARLLAAAGLPGVEETLREGLRRLPGDEKLTLLLAAALERSGQRAAAGETLARLRPETNDGGGAARHRYNRAPVGLLEALVADLDREAAAHVQDLKAALERTAK